MMYFEWSEVHTYLKKRSRRSSISLYPSPTEYRQSKRKRSTRSAKAAPLTRAPRWGPAPPSARRSSSSRRSSRARRPCLCCRQPLTLTRQNIAIVLCKLWRARFRLYRNQILQENMRLTAFFKLYKMCTLSHRCALKILPNNRFETSAIFVRIPQFFANVATSAKICRISKISAR